MRRDVLLGAAALFVLATVARADFIYQGRFITIHIRGNRSDAPAPLPPTEGKFVQPPPGLPLEVAPPRSPVPVPGATVAPQPATTVFTVDQFASSFKPAGGNYKVTLIHPITNCPVEVCFTLPEGCPKVRASRRLLEYDYGKSEVELHFERNGQVRVKYLK